MTLALSLAFAALALLALLALVWSRWAAWLRVLLVGAVTLLYFVADDAVQGLAGWPHGGALPPRFVLLAAVFDEPSATHKGALHVWVNAVENGKPASRPRAYTLPYSKDLHALLDEGLKKARQGVVQLGTAEPKAGPRGWSWLRPGQDEQTVKIRDLPSPQLPEK